MRLIDRMNYALKWVVSGLLFSILFAAQGETPFVHSVNSEENGRVYQYSVIFQEMKFKKNSLVTYFWHRNGQLRSTSGDYSGNILHGSFQEFDKSGKMLEKGTYYFGAKDGEWKSWNRDGVIIKLEKWNRGFLHQRIRYNLPGFVLEKYKHNQLNFRRIVLNNNEKDSVEHYRNGKIVVPNKKSFKSVFFRKKPNEEPDVVDDK